MPLLCDCGLIAFKGFFMKSGKWSNPAILLRINILPV
jgi:hypothetical protein